MKRIILVTTLFSIFSSLFIPMVNALPVGNGWGKNRNEIVDKLAAQKNLGETEKQILQKIIVPGRDNHLKFNSNKFEIKERYRSILLGFGLRNACEKLDKSKYSGQNWLECSINNK
ncbi:MULTISPECIES: hypothetical protein [unclassified Bartonella]|uniref:hypothetical protein n=1 Tax=unclassified Bartonella TaxID=2645622 RepID=UPI0009998099|nr:MULTISPECIES: hypothetical protein [unclassified Bartonella]AQX28470.1 hypothetical protein BJB15x_010980 [Bartonella sp. JB15]AQX29736.1 hypothetical protein BJB63x_010830 [Bartonella sp. JB63]